MALDGPGRMEALLVDSQANRSPVRFVKHSSFYCRQMLSTGAASGLAIITVSWALYKLHCGGSCNDSLNRSTLFPNVWYHISTTSFYTSLFVLVAASVETACRLYISHGLLENGVLVLWAPPSVYGSWFTIHVALAFVLSLGAFVVLPDTRQAASLFVPIVSQTAALFLAYYQLLQMSNRSITLCEFLGGSTVLASDTPQILGTFLCSVEAVPEETVAVSANHFVKMGQARKKGWSLCDESWKTRLSLQEFASACKNTKRSHGTRSALRCCAAVVGTPHPSYATDLLHKCVLTDLESLSARKWLRLSASLSFSLVSVGWIIVSAFPLLSF